MNTELFSDWLSSLALPDRIRALALIYSGLTIGTRQFFLPDVAKGKEAAINKMLQGVNELHHTLANWLVHYTTDERKAFPVDVLGRQLTEIASYYRIDGLLTSSVERVRTGEYPTAEELSKEG